MTLKHIKIYKFENTKEVFGSEFIQYKFRYLIKTCYFQIIIINYDNTSKAGVGKVSTYLRSASSWSIYPCSVTYFE